MRKAFNELLSKTKAHRVEDMNRFIENDESALSKIGNHEKKHENTGEESSLLCTRDSSYSFGRPSALLSQSSPSKHVATQAAPVTSMDQEPLDLGYEAEAESDTTQRWVEDVLSAEASTDQTSDEEHENDVVDLERPEAFVDTPPEQSDEEPVGRVFSHDDIARLATWQQERQSKTLNAKS